jgi:hypothetical protein
MLVWMPQMTTLPIPSPSSHPRRSGVPWKAEWTVFVAHEHDRLAPLAPGGDERTHVRLAVRVVPRPPELGVVEPLLHVHHQQGRAIRHG